MMGEETPSPGCPLTCAPHTQNNLHKKMITLTKQQQQQRQTNKTLLFTIYRGHGKSTRRYCNERYVSIMACAHVSSICMSPAPDAFPFCVSLQGDWQERALT